MSVFILSQAIIKQDDIIDLKKMPEFRKATKNMILSYLAASKVLSYLSDRGQYSIGIVVGSGHGELQATNSFCKDYTLYAKSRPIFFQNSLHNSTLGYLANKLQLSGSATSMSNSYFSGEDALDFAIDEIKLDLVDLYLVIGVDCLCDELSTSQQGLYPLNVNLSEGASALLLSSDSFVKNHPTAPLGTLKAVEYSYHEDMDSVKSVNFENFYDSNAIEQIILSDKKSTLNLPKPNGQTSSIIFGDIPYSISG